MIPPEVIEPPKVRLKTKFRWEEILPLMLPAQWHVLSTGMDGRKYGRVLPDGKMLTVIASVGKEPDGKHWLHVSVAHPNRLPTYDEVCQVKDLFIGEERTAYHLFPKRSKHVNIHPNCLHLWSCLEGDVTPDFTHGTGSI